MAEEKGATPIFSLKQVVEEEKSASGFLFGDPRKDFDEMEEISTREGLS